MSTKINELKKLVSRYTGVPPDKFDSRTNKYPYKMKRKREMVLSRYYTMSLLYKYTKMSLEKIGEIWSTPIDHSTVIHACRTIDDYLETDSKIRADYNELKKKAAFIFYEPLEEEIEEEWYMNSLCMI